MGNRISIRTILELLGFVESKQAAVKKKLGIVSQAKPRGPVTLLVKDIGKKQIGAISLIRKLTGLTFDEATVVLDILPWPLLRNVSLEAAIQAKEDLERVGVKVELIGVPTESGKGKTKIGLKPVIMKGDSLPGLTAGDYTVVLNDVGLLEHRIIEGMQKYAQLSLEQSQSIIQTLPKPIAVNVDEESAFRIQRELQMMGAVIDVNRVVRDQPDEERTEPRILDEAQPETIDTPKSFGVRLIDAGPYLTPLMHALHEITGLETDEITAILESLPGLILEKVDDHTARKIQKKLQSVGAIADMVSD